MWLLLLSLLFLAVVHPSTANQDDILLDSDLTRPRFQGALFLLESKERDRFVTECMQPFRVCSKQEIEHYIWQNKHVQNIAEDWFWGSYVCFRKNDPLLCPVDGGWTHWGAWRNCSASCGRGLVSRYRECTHPTPENAGRECMGSGTQVSDCETHIPCYHQSGMKTNVTETLVSDMMTYLKTFHKEDPHLERACLKNHCSYQQVLGMIQPVDLANHYWTRLSCFKNLEGCPVAGGWSPWTEWSQCTSECGTGQTFRSRHCDDPHPSNGGEPCQGEPMEERDCFQETCANTIGTFLTDWTPWTSCSEGCGLGTKVSSRRCHGSDTCQVGIGDTARQVSTLMRRAPCMADLCPIAGGWSPWSDWSLCNAICGPGYHIRVRSCNKPLPVGLGNACSGDGYEKAACTHSSVSCSGVPTEREYGLWSSWSKCSSSCDGGVRLRHRSCLDHQTMECTGPVYNIWPCNIKVPCPVDGDWSEWSAWTSCSLTCGIGQTERYRLCSTPSPRHGGKPCEGDAAEVKKCRFARCPALMPRWGSWGEWDDCSATCEGGTKSRQRWCLVRRPNDRRLVRVKMARNCAGEFQQFAVCNTHTCPVDGSWASWSKWSTCTATCGEGVMTRDRSCTDPAPISTGDICGGFGTEINHCFKRPCPRRGNIHLVFDGSSFLIYRRSAHPARHLLIFLTFRPADPHGLLVLRRDDEWTEVVMMLRLVDSRVQFYAEIGPDLRVKFEGDQIRLNKWNSLEAGVTSQEAWLRVNDGDVTVYHIDAPIPDDIDWDLPMYIGGALPNLFPEDFERIGGFTGKIAELRVNYREYSLHETEDWEGGGLPYVNLDVEEEESKDIDSEVPTLTGEEYTILSCPPTSNATDIAPILISLTLRPADGEGVVLYITGEYPGSFFMLSLQDSNLVLTMSLGHDQEVVQRTGSPLELNKWSLVDVRLEGFIAELRVGKGPATQLTSIGHAHFRPSSSLYVGGVSLRDRLQAAHNAGATHGFVGEILEVTINWMDYRIYEAALTTDVLVNSASATIAAHFRDIQAPVSSSVLLRCQYGHVVDEIGDAHRRVQAQWLYNGDRLLEFSPLRKIIPSDPGHPYSASLLLIAIPKSAEGFYACQVTFRGVSIVTHAFSVSVTGVLEDGPSIDRMIDIIIVLGASSVLIVAIIIVLLSCCVPCRKRSYFLDLMYDSLMQCCGCKTTGALPPGLTYADLARVDATYREHFSPRAEKAKLDANLSRRRYNESLQEKGNSDSVEDEESTEEDASTDEEEQEKDRLSQGSSSESSTDELLRDTTSERRQTPKRRPRKGGDDDSESEGQTRTPITSKSDVKGRNRQQIRANDLQKQSNVESRNTSLRKGVKMSDEESSRKVQQPGEKEIASRRTDRTISTSKPSQRPDMSNAKQQLMQEIRDKKATTSRYNPAHDSLGALPHMSPPPRLPSVHEPLNMAQQLPPPPPLSPLTIHPPLLSPERTPSLSSQTPHHVPSDLPRPYHSPANLASTNTFHSVVSPRRGSTYTRRHTTVGISSLQANNVPANRTQHIVAGSLPIPPYSGSSALQGSPTTTEHQGLALTAMTLNTGQLNSSSHLTPPVLQTPSLDIRRRMSQVKPVVPLPPPMSFSQENQNQVNPVLPEVSSVMVEPTYQSQPDEKDRHIEQPLSPGTLLRAVNHQTYTLEDIPPPSLPPPPHRPLPSPPPPLNELQNVPFPPPTHAVQIAPPNVSHHATGLEPSLAGAQQNVPPPPFSVQSQASPPAPPPPPAVQMVSHSNVSQHATGIEPPSAASALQNTPPPPFSVRGPASPKHAPPPPPPPPLLGDLLSVTTPNDHLEASRDSPFQDLPQTHSPSIPEIHLNDLLREKMELNRRRRLSSGARVGSGHALSSSSPSPASREDDNAKHFTATYMVTREDGPPDTLSVSENFSLPSGDFIPLKSRAQGITQDPRDVEYGKGESSTLGLVSELMDSLERTKFEERDTSCGDRYTPGSPPGDAEEKFICEECQQGLGQENVANLQSHDIMESNDDDFESCGENSP